MKHYLLILFTLITIASCKNDSEEPVVKEKIKLYIRASLRVHTDGTPPQSMQISGTNLETVNNVTSVYTIEVDYPKGETQTITLKGNQTDTDLHLEVSKGVSLNSDMVAAKVGRGTISVTFIAN